MNAISRLPCDGYAKRDLRSGKMGETGVLSMIGVLRVVDVIDTLKVNLVPILFIFDF